MLREKKDLYYARFSYQKQKGDLERQIKWLQDVYSNVVVIFLLHKGRKYTNNGGSWYFNPKYDWSRSENKNESTI